MDALKMMGLGSLGKTVYIDDSQPWLGTKEVADTSTSSGGGFLDWLIGAGNTVKNAVDKFAPTVQTATSLIDQIKNGNATYNPNLTTTPANNPAGFTPPGPTFWQQHGTKVVIGGGILAATAIGVYALKDSKKKK